MALIGGKAVIMSGQMMEIVGYALCGVSGLLLILSEVIFRHKKKKIIRKVYDEVE